LSFHDTPIAIQSTLKPPEPPCHNPNRVVVFDPVPRPISAAACAALPPCDTPTSFQTVATLKFAEENARGSVTYWLFTPIAKPALPCCIVVPSGKRTHPGPEVKDDISGICPGPVPTSRFAASFKPTFLRMTI